MSKNIVVLKVAVWQIIQVVYFIELHIFALHFLIVNM